MFGHDSETGTFSARRRGFRNIDFQSVSPAGLQPAVAERRNCADNGEHLPLGAQGKALCSGAAMFPTPDHRSVGIRVWAAELDELLELAQTLALVTLWV
jgi:hypothetical protein